MAETAPDAFRTIVALSTGSVPSGVAVVRLSGQAAFALVEMLCGALPPARTLALRRIVDPVTGRAIDHGLVAVFPAPNSFTGEDCAEFQVHGSPAGVKALLGALLATGRCQIAGAGEFTRRAFENGKLDLTAVEGLGDLLAAETESQRRQALIRLEGALAGKVLAWRDLLLDLRAEIEAHLDFSDEDDVPADLSPAFQDTYARLVADIEAVVSTYAHGRLVRDGFRIVLYGAPNAGKSSLLNALAGSETAIVTAEAGTTRDLKEIAIDLAGHKIIIVDTAGLRDTESVAEAAGIALTARAVSTADLVLWLTAPDAPDIEGPRTKTAVWQVRTKTDLGAGKASSGPRLAVTTRTANGISALIAALQHHMEEMQPVEPALVSHTRDHVALESALQALYASAESGKPMELVGEDLRVAADAMARLVGAIDTEQVLDRLFQGFCIGK